MLRAVSDSLGKHYAALQSKWAVIDRMNDYGQLVVPTGNADEAFHRWFHLKEAFSSRLLHQIVKEDGLETGRRTVRILDCFAGGGTTLVSAGALAFESSNRVHATGYETNPFLHLVSETKCGAMVRGTSLADELEAALPKIIRRYKRTISGGSRQLEAPALSTFHEQKYFPGANLHRLLALRSAILATTTGMTQKVLLLAAASIVEACSRLRKDGRALRFEPGKDPAEPLYLFERRLGNYLTDARLCPTDDGRFQFNANRGDSRKLLKRDRRKYDIILFSPPYPNNIDYTEVYKLEAWYLGLYRNSQDMGAQRLRTVRSHPSIRFPDDYFFESLPCGREIIELLKPILRVVPDDRYTAGRIQVIKGWVDDMAQVMHMARARVSENGRLTFVVGNSSHGTGDHQFVIASDILMCAVAEVFGWRVEEIRVARRPGRRSSSAFLRESVVVLRPRQEVFKCP